MNQAETPTKANLLLAKNTLRLCIQGYGLLDKKRNVLIKEIMELMQKANDIQTNIDRIFKEGYQSLQHANIDIGIKHVEGFSYGVPIETSVEIKPKSVMGVEIPLVSYDGGVGELPGFGFSGTTSTLDEAFQKFHDIKDLIIRLSMVENSAYRLAVAIRKTQKRANALKEVTIPRYQKLVKDIQETLEERERDEFTRLKVIKARKEKGA